MINPDNTPENSLTLEQEFSVQSFAALVKRMSKEQAQEFLVQLRRHMMLRENAYNEMLKDQSRSQ